MESIVCSVGNELTDTPWKNSLIWTGKSTSSVTIATAIADVGDLLGILLILNTSLIGDVECAVLSTEVDDDHFALKSFWEKRADRVANR